MFYSLLATSIARNWNCRYTGERPSLNSALFEFPAGVRRGIGLPDSCATLLSQVIGCASSATIWRSVFEIADPSIPPQSLPGILALNEAIPGKVSEETNSGTYTTHVGTHSGVDPRLRAELTHLTFPNTPGFMDAFFISYRAKATEILELKQFADLRSVN